MTADMGGSTSRRLAQLEADVAALREQRMDVLQAASSYGLGLVHGDVRRVLDVAQATKTDLSELRGEVSDVSAEVATLRVDVTGLSAAVAALRGDVGDLRGLLAHDLGDVRGLLDQLVERMPQPPRPPPVAG